MGVDANMTSRGGIRLPTSRAQDPDGRLEDEGRRGLADRRHDSQRATRRRREAEDALLDAVLLPSDTRNESVGSEGQILLMKALARLERQEDVDAAVAWSLDSYGEPIVIAAHPADAASRIPPTPKVYAALAELERVQRLSDPGLSPELLALAKRGISAAAPVPGLGTMPAALILLHPRKVGRPLRPRTIAVLGEVAAKLKKTLSTSLALERMGRLDGAIQQLDRLAALGGLVSEIVHEIRNPLVSVKTFLQLLPERLDDPEFHQGFRGVVEDEVGRLERMLEDLLRHARPAPANAPVEPEARIPEAIATTLQLLTYRCRERGVELVKDIRDELPALGLPEDALRQLLLNLLLNATEVTPRDGQIRIYADWSPESANHVELRIEDDGPGLDPALANNVFEPFWTTRQESPGGLGLAICKRIVDEAGGQIEVESEPTGGACFRIVLPIAS
jgi:signal transduction histidine kinase